MAVLRRQSEDRRRRRHDNLNKPTLAGSSARAGMDFCSRRINAPTHQSANTSKRQTHINAQNHQGTMTTGQMPCYRTGQIMSSQHINAQNLNRCRNDANMQA